MIGFLDLPWYNASIAGRGRVAAPADDQRLDFLSAAWPLNVRVSANSPSLCPTMFSLMNTGTCCLPL